MGIAIAVGIYLALGIIALVLLDLFTGRVRGRLKTASFDTQQLTGGSQKVALVVTILALWIFYPVAIYVAIRR